MSRLVPYCGVTRPLAHRRRSCNRVTIGNSGEFNGDELQMKATHLRLQDVISLERKVFGYDRACFHESFNHRQFEESMDEAQCFAKTNHSLLVVYVLDSLHYQIQKSQGRLRRVVGGEAFNVVVDIQSTLPATLQNTRSLLSTEMY
jgi:dTDP-4-dehydrorhamnose 3,5-epimerase